MSSKHKRALGKARASGLRIKRRATAARVPGRRRATQRNGGQQLLAVAGILVLVAGLLGLPALAGPHPAGHAARLIQSSPAASPAVEAGRAETPPPTIPPTQEPDGFNLLLLGCDRADPSWRTDVIMVAVIRPRAGFVGLFSIPRDLWVTIPGYGEERINAADYRGELLNGPGGGPALVAATLQQNLGITTQGYVRITFDGLVRVVDALGGVDVTSDRAYPKIGVKAGTQHMNGTMALAYVRDRTYTSDLDRGRRQQQLLLAMRQAAQRPAVLLQLPRLLSALPEVVQTDLSPGQIWSLANLALRLEPEAIRTRTFDYTMVQDWVTPSGAMVLLPRRDRIEQAWREVTAAE